MTTTQFNIKAELAPSPVTVGDVISIIVDELNSALFIGFGARRIASLNYATEYRDLLDTNYGALDDGCGETLSIDVLTIAAVDSVKQWARDLNVFYNNEKLKDCVAELLSYAFQSGWKSFNLDAAIDELDQLILKSRAPVNQVVRDA